jgi:hypothetical protein
MAICPFDVRGAMVATSVPAAHPSAAVTCFALPLAMLPILRPKHCQTVANARLAAKAALV